MASINKVTIIGNLGKDPVVRYMPNGDAVADLSVATTEKWKDKNGEKFENTEWHRVTLFRKQAEVAGEYLRKGDSVYIEGKIVTDKYTDKVGVEKYSTKVVAHEMKMLSAPAAEQSQKASEQNKEQSQKAPKQNEKQAQKAPKQNGKKAKGQSFQDIDDDIPF